MEDDRGITTRHGCRHGRHINRIAGPVLIDHLNMRIIRARSIEGLIENECPAHSLIGEELHHAIKVGNGRGAGRTEIDPIFADAIIDLHLRRKMGRSRPAHGDLIARGRGGIRDRHRGRIDEAGNGSGDGWGRRMAGINGANIHIIKNALTQPARVE